MELRDAAEAAAYLAGDDTLESADGGIAGGGGVLCAGSEVFCRGQPLGVAHRVGDLAATGVGQLRNRAVEIVSVRDCLGDPGDSTLLG